MTAALRVSSPAAGDAQPIDGGGDAAKVAHFLRGLYTSRSSWDDTVSYDDTVSWDDTTYDDYHHSTGSAIGDLFGVVLIVVVCGCAVCCRSRYRRRSNTMAATHDGFAYAAPPPGYGTTQVYVQETYGGGGWGGGGGGWGGGGGGGGWGGGGWGGGHGYGHGGGRNNYNNNYNQQHGGGGTRHHHTETHHHRETRHHENGGGGGHGGGGRRHN